MRTKNFFFVFSFAIVFIGELSIEIFAQSPCPNYSDLLDKGWAHTPGQDPHYPHQANWDEFAVTDPLLCSTDQ